MTTKAFDGLLEDEKIKNYLKDKPDLTQSIISFQQPAKDHQTETIAGHKLILGIIVIISLLVLWKYFTEIQTLQKDLQSKTQTTQE